MERRRLQEESLSSILRGDYAERFRFRFCAAAVIPAAKQCIRHPTRAANSRDP